MSKTCISSRRNAYEQMAALTFFFSGASDSSNPSYRMLSFFRVFGIQGLKSVFFYVCCYGLVSKACVFTYVLVAWSQKRVFLRDFTVFVCASKNT